MAVSLASRGSILGKAVLGLGFFLCPWPRGLCPRLHLWYLGGKGHWAMPLPLGRQDSIISIEWYAKLWHAPPPL